MQRLNDRHMPTPHTFPLCSDSNHWDLGSVIMGYGGYFNEKNTLICGSVTGFPLLRLQVPTYPLLDCRNVEF